MNHRGGRHATGNNEPARRRFIEFMLPPSPGRPVEIIAVPVTGAEFDWCLREAAADGKTIEQWLIAGLGRAISSPELLRRAEGA